MIAPFQRPALIDGLRFHVTCRRPGNGLPIDMALSYMVRVSCGPFALTDDFTTVASLSPRAQYNEGELWTAGGSVPHFLLDWTDSAAAQYEWRFAEPFFVPARIPMRVSIKRSITAQDDEVFYLGVSATVQRPCVVSAVGRYFVEDVDAPPGLVVPVPFGNDFLDPSIPIAGDLPPVQVGSTELDLTNRSEGMLYADKMVGRLPSRQWLTTKTIGEYTGPEPTISIDRTYSARGARPFRLATNRGIVNPAKPFSAVFDVQSRSLDLNGARVPPGEGFGATILKVLNATTSTSEIRVFPVLGLTGVREGVWR
jgi:hypothetical protein